MIRCKLCGKKEYHGTLFCSDCGSQLIYKGDEQVNTLVYNSKLGKANIDIGNTIPQELLNERDFILFFMDGEVALDLPVQNEFTLGRLVEGQPIAPDIDLNKYDAFNLGVSRLHATIRINPKKNQVHVIDLGSANGSKVNGYAIPANSEVPLNHGDILTLGKFNLKVILPKEM